MGEFKIASLLSFHIILLITCSLVFSEKIIQDNYIMVGRFCISFTLDDSTEITYFEINQQLQDSYYNVLFNQETFIKEVEEITINSTNYKRNLNKGIIRIGDAEVANINYYSIPQSPPENVKYSGFTLALNPTNDTFSIVHQLYNNKQINKLVYAFEPIDDLVGYFYIGGVPQEILTNKSSAFCKVEGSDWGCELEAVYFSDMNKAKVKYLFKNKKKYHAFFQGGIETINAPVEYIDYLKNTIFKKYLENGDCVFEQLGLLFVNGFRCNNGNNIIESLPRFMNFIINDYVLSIPIQSLLYSYGGEGKEKNILFLVTQSLENGEEDTWTLGALFLNSFISMFDYENKVVNFYTSTKIEKGSELLSQFGLILTFIFTNMLLLIGIVIILFSSINKYKNFRVSC